MKTTLTVSIQKPCSEKFSNFSTTNKGGFCKSCSKEVIDFTKLTDQEVMKQLRSTSKKSCGQFKASQLKTYTVMATNSNSRLFSRGIAVMGVSLVSLCATSTLKAQDIARINQPVKSEISITPQKIVMGKIAAQTYTVTGTVLDEENTPLPGVNVVLKGTTEGVVTDIDGKFTFSRKLDINDTLVFSYIGYETKEYTITASESGTLDINIIFNASDIYLMGDVVIEGTYETKPNTFKKFISLFK